MDFIENTYEKSAIQKLSPKAKDLAEYLFSTQSLAQLLKNYHQQTLDASLLAQYGLPSTQAPKILSAVLLAKTTYFIPNPKWNRSEIYYLMQLACRHAGYPLKDYTLKEILIATKNSMTTFYQWLMSMEKMLYEKSIHKSI